MCYRAKLPRVYLCVCRAFLCASRRKDERWKQTALTIKSAGGQPDTHLFMHVCVRVCVCACIDLPYIHFFRTIKSSALHIITKPATLVFSQIYNDMQHFFYVHHLNDSTTMKSGKLWEEKNRLDVPFKYQTRLSLENDFWYLVSNARRFQMLLRDPPLNPNLRPSLDFCTL